jgi:NifU-like protein involved in Fe-S cluster formation
LGRNASPPVLNDRLLDHFRNPRHAGELPPPAVVVEASNPACGDLMRLSARWDGDRIAEARYQVRGCSASIACGSVVTEWLAGKSRAEVAALRAVDVEAAAGGLAAESRHAAVLCADAVRALLGAGGA